MNTHRSLTKQISRLGLVSAAGAIVALAGIAAPASAIAAPAAASTSAVRVPATGAVVTCDGVGTLAASDGYLWQSESIRLDARGRAHGLFTIATHHVDLIGSDGARYRLLGGGYDYVVYPGSDVTGPVLLEDEAFYFDVIGRHGVVGVVRLRVHTGPDQIPHVNDTSTCQLPDLS